MKKIVYIVGLIVVLSVVFKLLIHIVPLIITALIVVGLLFVIDKSGKKI